MLSPADQPLPPLREDLQLCNARADAASGEPAWIIQDNVINRFYRIGWLEFECLLRWGGTARDLCARIGRETALKPDAEQIVAVRQFLEQHHLVRPFGAAVEKLAQRSAANPWLQWRWWLHHYLFFRVPLLRPQQKLRVMARYLDWLFTPVMAVTVCALSLLGIVLVLHQWDAFSHAVVESFTGSGLLSFACALIVAKTFHELGHALVATRQGLRVAHMGIAFVVLWPMLYTDTGESWKLPGARQRLAIASAGILTELALAGLATLGWALCAEGPLRNGLLYLATTSWVLSLALNASPFMRFDGYFILTDLLDFPNLHERSFAIARTAIRRTLLGLEEEWPEPFPAGQRRLLVAFAVLTWIYRLLLFIGIAIAVYLLFFKVLGIFLFAVEIAWFILMPAMRELKYWWAHRDGVSSRRKYVFWAAGGLLMLLLAVPWESQIHGYGVAKAARQVQVFAPFPAKLSAIHAGGAVSKGAVLLTLDSPELDWRMRQNEAGITSYQARLSGMMADPAGLAQQSVTRRRLAVERQAAMATQAEISRLKLTAPFDGLWLDLDPEVSPGQWVSPRAPLGVLLDPSEWHVEAYVDADEVDRLRTGSPAKFYVEGAVSPVAGRLVSIGSTRAARIEHPALSARFGGPVATAAQTEELAPLHAVFPVTVKLDHVPDQLREARGQLQIEGARRSLLGEWFRQLASVFLRESGF